MSDMSKTTFPTIRRAPYTFELHSGAGMFGRDAVVVTSDDKTTDHQFDLQDGLDFDSAMVDQWLELISE